MGDEARRRLERAAAAGDVEAGAQLLVLRQRDGSLDWDRLVLASYLGDPAAQTACGDRDVPDVDEVARWAMSNLGAEAVVLMARAMAGLVAPPERLATLKLESIREGEDDDPGGDFDLVPGGHTENVLHAAVRTIRATDPWRKARLLERTLRLTREAFDDAALRRALREALVPWLLGPS